MKGKSTPKSAAKPAPMPVEPEPEEIEVEDELEPVDVEIDEEVEAAPSGRLDETVPGGRYLVGGKLVNADGEPI